MKKLTNKRGLGLSSSKGFTLIEVVLVLAIGGLIFLLAFIAFQQVSANRRDTQRRADAGRFIAEVQNARGDRNGAAPFTDQTTLNAFLTTYFGGTTNTFTSNGITYTVTYGTAVPATATGAGVATMSVSTGQKCNGAAMTGSQSNTAILVGLEKGVACRDDL
jgi:prepilin-type N-terminal cleavage/methylation domain-containing protein